VIAVLRSADDRYTVHTHTHILTHTHTHTTHTYTLCQTLQQQRKSPRTHGSGSANNIKLYVNSSQFVPWPLPVLVRR